MTKKDVTKIQEIIGYNFKNEGLLVQAFIRSSYADGNSEINNEQLEFVGDKVLDYVIVKKLVEEGCRFFLADYVMDGVFEQDVTKTNAFCYFKRNESEMTELKKQLVQTSFLASAIEKLGLDKYLLMGKSDVNNGVQNQPSVKEDLFEAIVGAVAIDSNWDVDKLEVVIEKMLNLQYHIENGVEEGVDYVSYVHNWHQQKYGTPPKYSYYDDSLNGTVECLLTTPFFDTIVGDGSSEKMARKETAKLAYDCIKNRDTFVECAKDIVGEYGIDNAINKIQILHDKKLIKELCFMFSEKEDCVDVSGNPIWECQCVVGDVFAVTVAENTKKVSAKKEAAFKMLKIILGDADENAYLRYTKNKLREFWGDEYGE